MSSSKPGFGQHSGNDDERWCICRGWQGSAPAVAGEEAETFEDQDEDDDH